MSTVLNPPGFQQEAMDAYFREGEQRALALGNRGPIRFGADGKLLMFGNEDREKAVARFKTEILDAAETGEDLRREVKEFAEDRFGGFFERALRKAGIPLGRFFD